MKNLYKRCVPLVLFMACMLAGTAGRTQASVSAVIDNSSTDYQLRQAFALPGGKTGVISLAGSRYVCIIVNANGSIASSVDFTGHLSLQNTIDNIEMNAAPFGSGNIFIVYSSSTVSGAHNSNQARFIILNSGGSFVTGGNLNAVNAGTSLNRFISLATLSNGNVAATWLQADNQSGALRVFKDDGTAVTGDIVFAGPASSLYNSTHLSDDMKMGASSGGGMLFTFINYGGQYKGMYFTNEGTVVQTGGANAFVIDPATNYGQLEIYNVIGLSNGNYMLHWAAAGTGSFKILNGSGADVKPKSPLHEDLAFAASWGGWVGCTPNYTPGKQGFAMAAASWQNFDDGNNPYSKVVAYNFDLSGNFLSSTDLNSYAVSELNPKPVIYAGTSKGIGLVYTTYKTFTPGAVYYSLPADADISIVTHGFASSVLAVQLVSFSAALQPNREVLLQWTTAAEENNRQFRLERKGESGVYQPIAVLPATAANGASKTYSVTDRLLFPGVYTYRLLQQDTDGQERELGTRSIRVGAAAVRTKVFPNPVTAGSLTLVTAPANKTFEVYNLAGHHLQSGRLSEGTQQVDVQGLPAGVYVIAVDNGESVMFEKR